MRTTTVFLLRAAALFAFASALSPQALCQNSQMENATREERNRRAGEDARRHASWELKMLEQRKLAERREAGLAWSQIRDDYKQLQVVNNDLAVAVSKGGALDLEYVAKSAAEIRKRALRLRDNMELPEVDRPAERPRPPGTEAEQLKASLVQLDRLVLGFVKSPIFERLKAAEVQTWQRARRNLEEIIVLSEQIKKSSEKLKKDAQK